MPATEKTWRDQVRMHVIFGVSALVMLFGTVWMLAKDHLREWRHVGLANRNKQAWTATAELAQQTAMSESQLERLRAEVTEADRSHIDPRLIERFKERVLAEDARLADAGVSQAKANFGKLDQAATNLAEAEEGSLAAADAREDVQEAMGDFVDEASRRENELTVNRKFKAAEQTAIVSRRGIAIGEGRPPGEIDKIEAEIKKLGDVIAELDVAVANAKSYRQDLEGIVREVEAVEADLQRQIFAIEADLNRLQENVAMNTGGIGEWVNRWPVLDALYNGNIKLEQVWLPDMTINYNFSSVARYDRCVNCHRAIDATAPGSATEPAYPAIPKNERVRAVSLQTPNEAQIALAELYGITLVTPAEGVEAPDTIAIENVAANSPADHAGLKAGDTVQRIDGTAVESATDVSSVLDPAHWRGALEVTVLREGEEIDTELATPTVESLYGFRLAPHGQIDYDAITVQVVMPGSLAARAGLEMGDIIERINGGKIHSHAEVSNYLLNLAEWGKPIELTIRRGLDQPYTSHPRLDLFVGGSSPHKKGEMGCTICHDGQGSATDFKWASHTPNSPEQALEWSRQHGWFDNHHWIFPMTPQRFIESNCLKCHHEVVELEPSERFPEPPAPKLVEGYQLVREYGCYGCHEINGYDGPDRRIGPDLRIEPNYYEVAAQILRDPGLSEDERRWATTLVHSPDADSMRHQLMRSIQQDAAEAATADPTPQPRLTMETRALGDALKDVDTPGSFRRVGPSLRHLESKVEFAWLYSWIRRPADFRPSTRMPQFFGHYEHLEAEAPDYTIVDAQGNERQITDAQYTARFESIEIRALTEFLLANSQPFEYVDPPQGVESPSAERGKWLFESRGCLACHSHVDFPGIHSTQGPDLSRVAAKFNTGKGQRWLYSWLKSPNSYHTQTVMPNLYLDPITETDAAGAPTGRVTDPAADIRAFLIGVPADWQPESIPGQELSADELSALEDLTAVWLSASFPRRRAEQYARDGIPERLAATVKIDEQGLVGMTAANRTERQLNYVARRSLSRYGCFGCHDIPGYETAKPIGTPLANWGRKDTSQLAFENIGAFLATHGVEEDGSDAPAHGEGHEHGIDPLNLDPDTGFFVQSLSSHQRAGFLWQKLRMPRSFDYAATKTKRYDERLRMPKFPFTAEEREKVMTFVLGLVSEPPAEKYIYNPGPRQEAIVQGRHVLDKYNCAGCHVLDMERWKIAFDAELFESPPEVTDFPFLAPDVTQEQISQSLTPDRRGFLHADLHGMTTRSEETGAPNRVDIDGVPLEPDDTESEPYYEFALYQPAVVAGATRLVGLQNLLIPADGTGYGPARGQAYPMRGGDLTMYLYSRVIAEEHKHDPAAKGSEAWSWLPPPLHDEGVKVQTDWLHDFLMDPTAIRPAVVLRMPNFHMSTAEAGQLVNYFAAKSNADFPYEYNQRRRGDYLARLEQSHPELLDDAMKIVTDGNYCVKCHSIGDYQVRGAIRTLGPDLDEVYRRLRPEYVRHWVGNPQRILPYTGMPVNIPYDPSAPQLGGVSQALFPGTSIQQLDGVVDLLMNFDTYAKRQTSVKSLVKEPAAAAAEATGALRTDAVQPALR